MRKFVTWNTIHTPHGHGSWALIDGMVTVRAPDGTKMTQIGGMDPENLARLLMWEIGSEAESAGSF